MDKDDKLALVIGSSLLLLIVALLIAVSTQQTKIRVLEEELTSVRAKNEQLIISNNKLSTENYILTKIYE